MNKFLKNKKMCIAIFVVAVLVLAGIIIGVAIKSDKDSESNGRVGKEQDVIIYDTDENTVEEKTEEGLKESDSEDGPVLSNDNMINFDGSDANDNQANGSNGSDSNTGAGNTGDDADEPKDENPKDNDEEDSKDTGSFGRFY